MKRLFYLYQCCVLIILNILEGNNPELNKAFLTKLDVKFLLKVIKKNFEDLGAVEDKQNPRKEG